MTTINYINSLRRNNIDNDPKTLATYPDKGQTSKYQIQQQPIQQPIQKQQPLEQLIPKEEKISNIFEKLSEWHNNIPEPKNKKYDDDELKGFIYYLIYNLINSGNVEYDDYIRSLMLTEENMIIWKKSLIHKSYNSDFNYEILKYFGDKQLEPAFTKWMIKKYPNITPDILTKYNHYYMTKNFQPKISILYKLDKWVLYDENINVDIKKDLFESFNGALATISKNVYDSLISQQQYQLASYINPYEVIYKNISFLFDNTIIDETLNR
jgi:dsRNA-specific ribonuclease